MERHFINRPTPETDAQINGKPCTRFAVIAGDSLRDALVPSEFARELERKRDEALEQEKIHYDNYLAEASLADYLAGELLKISQLSQITCMTFETQSFKATDISMQAWRKWKEARSD